MTQDSGQEPGPVRPPTHRKRAFWLTLAGTILLVPLVLLPYRWLWLPCGLAVLPLIFSSGRSTRDLLRRHDTLVFGPVAVLILRTTLDPGWWVPWVLVIGGLLFCRTRPWWSRRTRIAAVPIVLAASICVILRPSIIAVKQHSSDMIPKTAILVCAGDSLTSGLNHKSDAETYVARLRRRLPCTVINAGVANDRTRDLIPRLEKDVLRHKPTAVLLFIGGNDYLNGTPRSQFAADLETVVSRIAATRTRLVMVEVPSGIIWNPYAGIYRKVARRHGALLVPESRLRWWFTFEVLVREWLREPLTLDGIHLSPIGATKVANWLEPYVMEALSGR